MIRFPHRILILGALLGSSIVALFGYIVTVGATAVPASAAELQSSAEEALPPQEPGQAQDSPDDLAASGQEAPEQSGCLVRGSFPASILQWCDLITRYAHLHGLEPDLVAAVMLQESGGDPLAYSHSGAVGLLQVMPRDGIAASFMCQNGPCFTDRPSIQELQDPEFNIEYGTGMMANLILKYGNLRDALKAYGPMDVGYYYADKVLRIYQNNQ